MPFSRQNRIMKMPKASDEDKKRFHDVLSELTASGAAVVKPMFGQLGAFVNGNMFAGLFGSDIGVKLAAADAEELAAAGATPFGPAERPMGGYLSIPAEEDAAAWVARAHAHVSTMPPKAPKKR